MKISFSQSLIILVIGDDGVVVVPHKIAGVSPFFVPMEGKRAFQDVITFIARYPFARITLFADGLAQDFRSDDLPRLNFFDRAKLAKRRLKQAFPAARLTAILPFKKTQGRVLLIGVHETNPVCSWAERLRARLPNIALLPVEGARIAARLMPEAADGWAMMISRQKSGGFRQIVTYKNDLVFTRLTPLPPINSQDDNSEIVARDIKASLDYLSRYGLGSPNELSVLLLMTDDIHRSLDFKNLCLKSIRSLSPANAAQMLNLPFMPETDDPTADIVFAAYLATRIRPALSMMLPDMRKLWLTKSIQQWGMRVGIASLLIAVCGTMWSAGDLAATIYQARKISVQLNDSREALKQAQANAAPLTEPLGRMRQALERRHIYEQETQVPWQGLNALAQGLDQDSKIVKLDWKNNKDMALEIFKVSLLVTSDPAMNDRVGTVAAFTRTAQSIAQAMPDYAVSVIRPPYPSLPQESVSATPTDVTEEPIGEISIQRKAP